MTYLAALPTQIVGESLNLPDGVDWPEIRYELHDLGDLDEMPGYGASLPKLLGLPTRAEGAVPTVAGVNAVFSHRGKWFAWRASDGGGCRSAGVDTRTEAAADIERQVGQTAAFWMEKVRWRINGDLADPPSYRRWEKPRPAIRCGGTHYVIGREPSDADLRGGGGGWGFGGQQMAFRMLATGERVQTRNCWYQGRIPVEFVPLLPNNAEACDSDAVIAQRARAAAWAEEREAKRQERAWRDEALRAWRGPRADLAAHEVLVAWEAADRHASVLRAAEYEAQRLVEQWRDDALRAWRGTWVDLIGVEQERWQAEQEYYAEMYEAERDAYYGSLL